MTKVSIAHVEAAIRHRNLSHRALATLMAVCGAIAVAAAAAELTGETAPAAPAGALAAWPDLATQALGHFSVAFVIAVAMAAVYELMVMRHVRGIARQVRSGAWLHDETPVRLKRDWLGGSDDLDRVVAALNEARDHGSETRSALTWRIARCQSIERDLVREVGELKAENAALRQDLREQADFARAIARMVGDCSHGVAGRPCDGNANGTGAAACAPDSSRLAGGGSVPGPLARVLEDFRDFSTAADDRPGFEPVPLEDAVRTSIADLREAIAASGARIEISDLPVVHGNRELLIRLFRTLIGGPLQCGAQGEPPVIRVLAGDTDGDALVRISVRDNRGTVKPRVVLVGQAPVADGQALDNLAVLLCRRVVRAHGGELTLDYESGVQRVAEVTLRAA